MTIAEVQQLYDGQYAELQYYQFKDKWHSCVSTYTVTFLVDPEVDENTEVEGYWLMNESEYEYSLHNECEGICDFDDWFGDKNAKILVIVLPWNWGFEEEEYEYV